MSQPLDNILKAINDHAAPMEICRSFPIFTSLINTFQNANYFTQNTPRPVVATPSFGNSVDKPSTDGASFVMKNKLCRKCGLEKPRNEFYYSSKYKRYSYYCKDCTRVESKLRSRAERKTPLPEITFLEGEIWLPVVGNEKEFMISNYGRVKSLGRIIVRKNGHTLTIHESILRHQLSQKGYAVVRLCNNKKALVHRLVAIAFIPNPNNKPEVNHIDHNKTNNRLENLEWVTSYENCTHKILNGRINYKAVVHIDDNGKIISRWASVNELSNEIGVIKGTVSSYIRLGKLIKGKKYAYEANVSK